VEVDALRLRRPAAEFDDGFDALLTKSTWPLKLSGVLCAGMLVLGRTAVSGTISSVPASPTSTPSAAVLHQEASRPDPGPALPKTRPYLDPAALSKRMEAVEVITFSPGNSSDGDHGDKGKHGTHHATGAAKPGAVEGQHLGAAHQASGTARAAGTPQAAATAKTANAVVTPQATAQAATPQTAVETAAETPGEVTGAAETATAKLTAPPVVQTAAGAEGATGAQGGVEAAAGVNVVGQLNALQAPVLVTGAHVAGDTGAMPLYAAFVGALLALLGVAIYRIRQALRRITR